jgi:thiol-disulfide isomerase/thioredoxin
MVKDFFHLSLILYRLKTMSKLFIITLLLTLSISIFAQSRRVNPNVQKSANPAVSTLNELTAKQMFDETNTYAKTKFAEFEEKKLPFNDKLYKQTLQERKQLAAKYTAVISSRPNLSGEDFYYLGMLHWIAENAEVAAENLRKFFASENPAVEKMQIARPIVTVDAARRKNFDEAEKLLQDYLKAEPVKMSERARMEGELAKSYRAEKDFTKAEAHAAESLRAIKAIFTDSASRAQALGQILDAGMLVFEIYKESDKAKEAGDALEDLRKTAVLVQSSSLYYYAADENIKYLIETNRKPLALKMYADMLALTKKDFAAKPLQEEILRRLKDREKHYKLLGETAPELTDIDRWLPGNAQTLASMRGKVVLLDFWATWCVPCIDAFPSLIEWYQTFQKDGLEILGVTKYHGQAEGFPVDNAAEIEFLQRFKRGHRVPYSFVVAKHTGNQLTYGATAIPTAVLIDRKGIIRYIETGAGERREEKIREVIVKLLAEK